MNNKLTVSSQRSALRARGFTLLEILIALAILALLGSALAKQTSSSARTYSQIEDRNEAMLLAENFVERIQVTDHVPLGRSETIISSNDKQWRLESVVESTSRPDMLKVSVSIYSERSREPEGPLVALHAYSGIY